MAEDKTVVSSVCVNGLAVADYDLVNFSLTTSADGATSAKAKDDLRKVVNDIQGCLDYLRLKEDVQVEPNRMKASMNVNVNYEWNAKKNRHEKKGFRAAYSLGFQTSAVDKASIILDALTTLDEVNVSQPSFKLRDLDELHKQGFKDAFERATARFNNECSTLGKNPDKFEVLNWSVRYSEQESGGRRVGATMLRAQAVPMSEAYGGVAPDPISIESGKAEVYVTLTLNYGKK